MTDIQGKSILVRVSEGSSYRESTVFPTVNQPCFFCFIFSLIADSILHYDPDLLFCKLVLASKIESLGSCSFQNILTSPIISQINTLLLPYFISYYSSAFIINQFHNHDAEVYAPYRLVVHWLLVKQRSVYRSWNVFCVIRWHWKQLLHKTSGNRET